MSRDAQAIQEPLQGVAGEDEVEVLLVGAGLDEQSRADRGGGVPFAHVRLSR